MDEVHFQQAGSRCRMWIPPEVKDPVVKHASTRFKVGYFGAVRLRDGALIVQRCEDSFNAENCWTFLRRLRREARRSGRRIVVILDNAGFHHARLHKQWRSKHERDFELMHLPAYSPDLNSIERVWKLTRRLCTHNRYFANLDAVKDAVEPQFKRWRRGSIALKHLCAMS